MASDRAVRRRRTRSAVRLVWLYCFWLSLPGVLLTAISLFAHHAFQAEYDAAKPVKVTGVVKRVEWTNPHIWF